MIWKLLRRNISVIQLVAYVLSCFTGLAIVLVSLKFYGDISGQRRADGNDAVGSGDYLVISKPVRLMSVFGAQPDGASLSFDSGEIKALAAQPWARKVGEFTAADFDISASVDLGLGSLSTALFFESMPDEFVDAGLDEWYFDPSKPMIPVIIPKDYLALYNYGFAAGRGMPRMSELLMSQIPLNITLSGQGLRETLPARVVGFSSRLNTIAVPDSFMTWANSRYGRTGSAPRPSRLIVAVDNPGDPAVRDWLESHGLEAAGDKLLSGRNSYIASVGVTVAAGVGAVISLLAVVILLLSIYLLIAKSRDKLRSLISLGYSPSEVARRYYVLIGVLNLVVAVGAVCVTMAVARLWSEPVEALGGTLSPAWVVGAEAVAIMAVVSLAGIFVICREVRKCF